MNKAHLPRIFASVLLLVGFFSTVPAFAYLYACNPASLTGGVCYSNQVVPVEYLSPSSNVMFCTWPDQSTALFYQAHSFGSGTTCGSAGVQSWAPLSTQTNLKLPVSTDRTTVPVFPSQIGAYIDSNGSNSTAFDFSSYLATGTAAQFFSAGLSMVAAALLIGHLYRVILSMLK